MSKLLMFRWDPTLECSVQVIQSTARGYALEASIRAILEQVDGNIELVKPFEPDTLQARFVIGTSDYWP